MNPRMTTPAKRKQVFQGVVTQLPWRCHTSAVDMMNVQVFSGAAVLASEVVTLQGFLSITSKVVIVFSPSDVFISLGILGQGLSRLLRPAFFQASSAMFLRPRRICEVGAALNALQRAAHFYRPVSLAESSQVKYVLSLPVCGTALWATLLSRTGGLVKHLANNALAFFKTIAGLSVGSQGACPASLQVGRCLRHLRSTIGAIQDPVLTSFHSLNTTLSVL